MTDTNRGLVATVASLLLSAALALALSGCQSDAATVGSATSSATGKRGGPRRASSLAQLRGASANKGKDVPVALPPHTRMDVYRLVVPFGTVSRNETFWKRIDEQCVDAATHDVLMKNGIRVGQAPAAEWAHFKAIMDEHPTRAERSTLVGEKASEVDIEVRQKMEWQNLFYFDAANTLHGRTYDHCENYIVMSFQQAPRKPGYTRVALCPVVKAVRTRLEFTAKENKEFELTSVRPEHLYQVNLRADVPPDSFLIVAPSAEATWPTSIGNRFLVHSEAAEQTESVLLIVPRQVAGE
jgi:hypothetical protein